MVAALKSIVGPVTGAYGFLAASNLSISNIGAIIGVASLFGAFAIVARYREALAVAEKESAIYTARDLRMTQENHSLIERVHELESRPNLASHAALLKEMLENQRDHSKDARDDSRQRQQRDERIIALLDMICEKVGVTV